MKLRDFLNTCQMSWSFIKIWILQEEGIDECPNFIYTDIRQIPELRLESIVEAWTYNSEEKTIGVIL